MSASAGKTTANIAAGLGRCLASQYQHLKPRRGGPNEQRTIIELLRAKKAEEAYGKASRQCSGLSSTAALEVLGV
jgi:hypothetical protein